MKTGHHAIGLRSLKLLVGRLLTEGTVYPGDPRRCGGIVKLVWAGPMVQNAPSELAFLAQVVALPTLTWMSVSIAPTTTRLGGGSNEPLQMRRK